MHGRPLSFRDADARINQHARVGLATASRMIIPLRRTFGRRRVARNHEPPMRSRTSCPRASRSSRGWTLRKRRVPQTGRMKLKFGNKADRLSVSTLPHSSAEDRDPDSSIRRAQRSVSSAGLLKDREDRTPCAQDHPAALRHGACPAPNRQRADCRAVHPCRNNPESAGVNIANRRISG